MCVKSLFRVVRHLYSILKTFPAERLHGVRVVFENDEGKLCESRVDSNLLACDEQPECAPTPPESPRLERARRREQRVSAATRSNVLSVLQELGHRVKFAALRAALAERRLGCAERTLYRCLAQLESEGLVNHRDDVRPPGYGMASWDGPA